MTCYIILPLNKSFHTSTSSLSHFSLTQRQSFEGTSHKQTTCHEQHHRNARQRPEFQARKRLQTHACQRHVRGSVLFFSLLFRRKFKLLLCIRKRASTNRSDLILPCSPTYSAIPIRRQKQPAGIFDLPAYAPCALPIPDRLHTSLSDLRH